MKKKMQKLKKQIKGITLIALVITIIVLLILAAVAINLTIGSNGIYKRAQNSVDIWKKAETDEEKEMNDAISEIDKIVDGNFVDNGEINIQVESLKNIMMIVVENKNISEETINKAKDQTIKECDTIDKKENIFIQYMGFSLGLKTEEELLNYLFESGETDVLYKSFEEYYEATKTDDRTYEEYLSEGVMELFEKGVGIFDITIKTPSGKVDTITNSIGNENIYAATYISNEFGIFEITVKLHGTDIGKAITYNSSEKEYKVSIQNNKARLVTDFGGQEVRIGITNAYIYINGDKIEVSDCISDDSSGTYLNLYDVRDKIQQDLPWEIELVSDNISAKGTFSEWQLT